MLAPCCWSAAAIAAPARASTFNISPIRAELEAAHKTEALTLTNADDSPVVVQIRVVSWSQKDGTEQLEDTRELLATPPVLQIPPTVSKSFVWRSGAIPTPPRS